MAPKGMSKARRERAADALVMRGQGMTYRQIAAELKVGVGTAYDDVKDALHEIIREPAEELRDLELERLDGMLLRLNTELSAVVKARKADHIGADKSANSIARIVDSQLRVSDRRAQLLGLDKPKRIDLGEGVDLDATVNKIMTAASLAMTATFTKDGDTSGNDGVAP